MVVHSPCPCGSGDPSASCCGPILEGAPAPTAERLMRSRFTAFALGDRAHLLRSWHPATRPAELELDAATRWRRLQIVDAVGGGEGDAEGVVEFRASYRDGEGAGLLHERSRFARHEGRWVYLDGEQPG
ncbi:YchJ family protein [Homoserinibacter sp. YIM 151385]|uniref:YchJ family protein n=1 Tax=Homoserinibacter sp. YIM 151385 TaxID=2985506 RepID=UPI0022F02D76|nr:YchJ family metal-binding protein [Homoserinibacter sp. YIM 151385]WBU38780.1 YchJ family metal-binding protein [Homoserinibacter sp. YIM 151385]